MVIKNPTKSRWVNFSFKKSQAINAEVAGMRKNIETVLLAEFFLIKNISIVNAPNETKNIWWLIAITNVLVKSMYGSVKSIIIKIWNKQPPMAW